MATQSLKTFSVIKNGCLDVEREFLKDNVAFHFSRQRFKRKRNVLKSSNYNSIWSITPFQNLFKDSRFYRQLLITIISRKIIVFSVFKWTCVIKKSIWFIIAKDLSRNVKISKYFWNWLYTTRKLKNQFWRPCDFDRLIALHNIHLTFIYNEACDV